MKVVILFLSILIVSYANTYKLNCIDEKDQLNSYPLDEKLDLQDYSECEIIDLNKDNKKELFIYTNSMVNKCGYFISMNEKTNIYDNLFSKNEICDFIIVNSILISYFRNGAKWEYEYFEIKQDKLIKYPLLELNQKTLQKYNDIAYYLQQANANNEAIFLLEKILEKFPNRTVTYLNLADAYAGKGESEKAKQNYEKYINLMKQDGKESKIPQRVLEFK